LQFFPRCLYHLDHSKHAIYTSSIPGKQPGKLSIWVTIQVSSLQDSSLHVLDKSALYGSSQGFGGECGHCRPRAAMPALTTKLSESPQATSSPE